MRYTLTLSRTEIVLASAILRAAEASLKNHDPQYFPKVVSKSLILYHEEQPEFTRYLLYRLEDSHQLTKFGRKFAVIGGVLAARIRREVGGLV